MSHETPAAAPESATRPEPADSAEAMRQRVLALIEDQRIAQRGFAENATTHVLKQLAEKIKTIPTR